MRRHGVKVDYIAADLAKDDEVDRLCQDMLKIHPTGADILINNAGIYVCTFLKVTLTLKIKRVTSFLFRRVCCSVSNCVVGKVM